MSVSRLIYIEEGMMNAPSNESHSFICQDKDEMYRFLRIPPKKGMHWELSQSGELMGRWRAVLVKD